MNAIVREWRGRVPGELADAYMDVLHATGLKNYAATPGHLGTLVLRRDGDRETEYVLLTFWTSEAAIRAFAGDEIGRAVYYPEDEPFLLEMPAFLIHYRAVFADGALTDTTRSTTGTAGGDSPVGGRSRPRHPAGESS